MHRLLGLEVPDDAERRPAGRPLGAGRVRLLPDVHARQPDGRAAVAADARPTSRTSTSASSAGTSRRCATGCASTSTATGASSSARAAAPRHGAGARASQPFLDYLRASSPTPASLAVSGRRPAAAPWTAAPAAPPRRRPRPCRRSRARAASRPASRAASRCSVSRRVTRSWAVVDEPPDLLVDEAPASPRRPPSPANGFRRPAGSDGDRSPISSLMPQRPTIARAMPVTCSMSDSAPVVMSPKTISSATRPPSATSILASSACSS